MLAPALQEMGTISPQGRQHFHFLSTSPPTHSTGFPLPYCCSNNRVAHTLLLLQQQGFPYPTAAPTTGLPLPCCCSNNRVFPLPYCCSNRVSLTLLLLQQQGVHYCFASYSTSGFLLLAYCSSTEVPENHCFHTRASTTKIIAVTSGFPSPNELLFQQEFITKFVLQHQGFHHRSIIAQKITASTPGFPLPS